MAVRAIRGAIQVEAQRARGDPGEVTELVTEVMARNELTTDDVISVIFTATPDLQCGVPARWPRASSASTTCR